MRRLFVRRSLTAVGIYSSVALGFLGTVVATHEFNSTRVFGDYATVIFATGFLQSLFDLTVEEALVKYGFRYSTREDWGRFRRLFSSALRFKLAGSLVGALGLVVFSQIAPHTARDPAACSPRASRSASRSKGLAGSMLYLRGRYDIRSLLPRVVDGAAARRDRGRRALRARRGDCGRARRAGRRRPPRSASSGWLAFRRFPSAASRPLGEDRREIFSFILQSSAATGDPLAARRARAAPARRRDEHDAGRPLPRRAGAAVRASRRSRRPRGWSCSPSRRATGRRAASRVVLRGVRRYSLVASGGRARRRAAAPDLDARPHPARQRPEVRRRRDGGAAASSLAAAVQLVVGWTKSFPVTIGTPGPAHPHARHRDDRGAAARRSCSARCGARRRRGRRARRHVRVRGRLGGRLPAHRPGGHRAADAASSTSGRRSREGSRRLGHLAARRRRPCEPRARRRGVPARARPRRRGRVDRDRRARAAGVSRCTGSRRSLPKGAIHVRTGLEVARRAARADVVYTTGMFGRSARGRRLARRPYVIKLTADPAFERARRRGIVGGDVDEFQRDGGGAAVRVLRIARDAELAARRARLHAERVPPRARASRGASTPDACPCCRIRRRSCRRSRRATSCGDRSA